MTSRVASFISRRWRVPETDFRVEIERLRGGLESTVTLARIVPRGVRLPMPRRFVVKQLPAGFEREAEVYALLWRHLDRPPAVRVLGLDMCDGATYLYLEDARPVSSWPWSDVTRAGAVCRELARLHDNTDLPADRFSWDYDGELVRSAEETLALAKEARDPSGRRFWHRIGDLKRVVAALPGIRRRLLSGATAVIHGDMHPGNVLVRGVGSNVTVALIDWARARVGSPLEDVASWLHALGCWEPRARQRHDTLMRTYLEARSVPRPFRADLRFEYALASVSNGLAGAVRYHLAVLSDPARSDAARYDSHRGLVAWERVIVRAAALLSTNPARCT